MSELVLLSGVKLDVDSLVADNLVSLFQADQITYFRGKRRAISFTGSRITSVEGASHCSFTCEVSNLTNLNISGSSRKHTDAGLLSVRRVGELAGQEFAITFGKATRLDSSHLVIARVVEGMEFVRAIEFVPLDGKMKPQAEIGILGCGLATLTKQPKEVRLMNQLASEQASQPADVPCEIVKGFYGGGVKKRAPKEDSARSIGRKLIEEAFGLRRVEDSNESVLGSDASFMGRVSQASQPTRDFGEPISQPGDPVGGRLGEKNVQPREPSDPDEPDEPDDSDEAESNYPDETESDSSCLLARLKGLSRQLNACKEENRKQVEIESQIGSNFGKQLEYAKSLVEADSGDKDEAVVNRSNKVLHTPALAADKQYNLERKKEKNKSFGWNVFNQDALYRAHKKRLRETPFDRQEYEAQKAQLGEAFYKPSITNFEPSEASKEAVARNLEKQYKKRDAFSRRRAFDDDARDIYYINERNRIFNKKLERSFGAHAAEIKQNLERGTAL